MLYVGGENKTLGNKEKYKEIKERKTEGKKEKREREGGRKEGR